MAPVAKKLTITGVDENSMFIQSRTSGVHFRSDVTFTNIKFQVTGLYNASTSKASTGSIYANGYTLEFTESVTIVPFDFSTLTSKTVEERLSYPVVHAGPGSNGSNPGTHGELLLYGGKYNYIYATGLVAAPSTRLVLGEKAFSYHNVHIGGTNAVVNGDVAVEIYGTANIHLNFNATGSSKLNGNLYVKFGKNGVVKSNFSNLSNLANYLADGKTMIVDASRNKAMSEKFESVVTAAGYTFRPYVENAPIFAGTQIRENAETYDARFAATIDSLEYDNIGFKINAVFAEGSKEWNVNCTTVYNALTALENGVEVSVTAEQFEGVYIYALTVAGVPNGVGAVTFTVTPYAQMGETTVNGNTYTVVCTPSANGVAVGCEYLI